MRRWLAVLLGATTLLGLASCSDDEDAEPAPDPRVTTSTAIVDRSGIALAPVAGETTTTIREKGSARLVGTVRGPSGPAAGATVRIERFVAGREIRNDVVTGPDGRFALEGVPGGRYRVRAFQPPTLAQVDSEIRFLADGAEHEFDLVMEEHSGLVVLASSAPEPAQVGLPVNLVVQVTQRQVDADGVIRTSPVTGVRLELTGLGRWVMRGSATGAGGSSSSERVAPSVITDGAGRARWELRCEAAGEPGLAVRVPVQSSATPPQPPATTAPQVTMQTIALDLPACVRPAPATTSTTTGPSTTTSPADDDG